MLRISGSIGGNDSGSTGVGKVEDTGLAWPPVTESLLSRSAEDATSTKEGVTSLFPVSTVTLPRSGLEAEDELKEE